MRGSLAGIVVLSLSLLAHAQMKGLHNYQLNPKSCRVNELGGHCMFVWECINSGGVHVGMCVDAFMFGTCCAHNLTKGELSRIPWNTNSPSVLYTPPKWPQGSQIKPPNLSRPSDHPSTRPPFITRPKPSSHYYDKWSKSTTTTTNSPNDVEVNQVDSTWASNGIRPQSTPTFITGGKPHNWPTGRPTKLRPAPPLSTVRTTTTTTRMTTTTSTTQRTTASTTRQTTPRTTTTPSLITSPPQTGHGNNAAAKGECGVAQLNRRQETRIVGGKNALFGLWPWQVSVRRTSFFGFSSTHRCGGAILNENWIATAGHCVDDLLLSQIRIRVGEFDFSSTLEPFPFQEKGAARKVVHPKYNFFTYEYDLAMVKVDGPIVFQAHVGPICLPGSDDLLIGENATVTGWGRLSDGGTLPSVLQQATVPIISNEQCKNLFLRAGRHEFFPDIFMCAGFERGGKDACQGDSGGPLQVKGKDGRFFLAGIISWGIGCGEENLPGVCTRISKFVPWILSIVT
ncbi:serine proteinase stubble [Cimex lectularius]|uniref:Peptidase S1 domain-containing protein n=1 Tax=Cimex lectularius TaxID=79782 RepID=A0A8I6SKS9_CIMLE|nr:serine proteinase stubble [Cimex lectularius]XP_014253935.1 serine proteinase stubble [Cimex lectularius]XP_024085037.1 serine proteinase stubble [Cimex lectularius]XP_024085038.1 serine proteinase stubble [Cimex lectularius]